MTRRRLLLSMGAVALFGAVGFAALTWEMQGVDEIGAREFPLSFKVVDAETDNPIPNASVRILFDANTKETVVGQSEGQTNGDGVVNLLPELNWTSMTRPLWGRRGSVHFWHYVLEVTARNYVPLSPELSDYTGSARPLHDPCPPPITIKMKRQEERK